MIKWSFSGLKQYLNCPNQYHEIKILKNYEIKVSPQMLYGTEVHKALEDYVRDGTELPKFYKRFKSQVDALIEIPGTRSVEFKMALTEDLEPCAFDAPDYWVRGIVDLMILDGDTAFVVDYKTGSNRYPDVKQLKLMALMIFEHFIEIQTASTALLFVVHNSFIPETYRRADRQKLWDEFKPDLARLSHSVDNGHWPKNPSGLCGYCSVTTCEFNRS